MPGPVVIDVAVGLVVVFLTSALICSAVVEWIGNVLNKRGDHLLRGLRELLDIPPSAPSEANPRGSVPASGGRFLVEKRNRRSCLQELSVTGANLRADLAGAKEPLRKLPTSLTDLVLAHPIIAGLHRPGRPGRAVDRRLGGVRVGSRANRMHLASYVSAQSLRAASWTSSYLTAPGTPAWPDCSAPWSGRLEGCLPGTLFWPSCGTPGTTWRRSARHRNVGTTSRWAGSAAGTSAGRSGGCSSPARCSPPWST